MAKAKLTNATSQKRRADELFKSQSITEQEHEQALLDYADAKRRRWSGPGRGGQRADPAGGHRRPRPDHRDGHREGRRAGTGHRLRDLQRERRHHALKMADLNLVQVRTLVDETDIGKIQAGQRATVTVDAYPNRPFQGECSRSSLRRRPSRTSPCSRCWCGSTTRRDCFGRG